MAQKKYILTKCGWTGLYMGEPFYAQYTMTFEGGKSLDDIAKQFELIQKNARDSKTGLLYHGWDESKQMP